MSRRILAVLPLGTAVGLVHTSAEPCRRGAISHWKLTLPACDFCPLWPSWVESGVIQSQAKGDWTYGSWQEHNGMLHSVGVGGSETDPISSWLTCDCPACDTWNAAKIPEYVPCSPHSPTHCVQEKARLFHLVNDFLGCCNHRSLI